MDSPKTVENAPERGFDEKHGKSIESSIPTPLQEKTHHIILEICADCPDAAAYIFSLFNLAMTWDHIEDDDPLDKDMAGRAFEAVVTQWPANTFFIQHSAILSVVNANCLSAWKATNEKKSPKIKALDVFCETVCAVCFILHGYEGVEKWMPEYRELIWKICVEDDLKDGGKL